jgi:hypothetical protein
VPAFRYFPQSLKALKCVPHSFFPPVRTCKCKFQFHACNSERKFWKQNPSVETSTFFRCNVCLLQIQFIVQHRTLYNCKYLLIYFVKHILSEKYFQYILYILSCILIVTYQYFCMVSHLNIHTNFGLNFIEIWGRMEQKRTKINFSLKFTVQTHNTNFHFILSNRYHMLILRG